jgi:hypothetical protein
MTLSLLSVFTIRNETQHRKAHYIPTSRVRISRPDWCERTLILAWASRIHEESRRGPEGEGHRRGHHQNFQAGAQSYVKKIIANITDYEFYTGESQDFDGMYV